MSFKLDRAWALVSPRPVMRLPANDRAFVALLGALQTGLVAFVGAGTSIPCGYPGWQALLDMLADEADVYDPRPPRTSPQLDADDLLWTAEEYRRRLTDDRYLAFVKKTFSPKPHGNAEALRHLVKLPIKEFLTTNYDDLLERVETAERHVGPTSFCWDSKDAVREFLAELTMPRASDAARRVVHLHGRWDDPRTVVLTERDYISRYVSSESTNRMLFGLFAVQPVFFIGFALGDPDLIALLREVQASLGPGLPRHYAILGLKDWNHEPAIRRRLEGKFGVSPVFYPIVTRPNGDDHVGLVILLRRLVDALAAARAASTSVACGGTTPSGLDPADPHKRAFGGSPEADGFALRGLVEPASTRPGWFSIQLKVTSIDPLRPLTDEVAFHLHPSFRDPVRTVAPIGGEAALRLLAYGAFTAGARVKQGGKEVALELDLAELTTAPHEFLKR
ncbi:SIR2 family protein [Sorangium sp. So ce131]|uniref:SIR2 family protein n=1 Tax=Sorangium sp. So ce131 TaxID=3133282 RepID=UPI003F605953